MYRYAQLVTLYPSRSNMTNYQTLLILMYCTMYALVVFTGNKSGQGFMSHERERFIVLFIFVDQISLKTGK